MAGDAVIALSSPAAPSVLFAFAELTSRAGVPAGVFNVLHGDGRASEALRAQGFPETRRLSGASARAASGVPGLAGRKGGGGYNGPTMTDVHAHSPPTPILIRRGLGILMIIPTPIRPAMGMSTITLTTTPTTIPTGMAPGRAWCGRSF